MKTNPEQSSPPWRHGPSNDFVIMHAHARVHASVVWHRLNMVLGKTIFYEVTAVIMILKLLDF
jgi:hypothetical protein